MVLQGGHSQNSDRSGDGEQFRDQERYVYFHYAYWQGVDHLWQSVRDWVAEKLEDLEDMVKRGKTMDA